MNNFCFRIRIISILASLFFFANSNRANAQFGMQLSLFAPKGDIGQYFSKGRSTDLYLTVQSNDNKWKERMGFFYTALSSRIDTARIYATDGTTVFPGVLVNKKFNMACLTSDISRRVVSMHGISLYLGIGLIAGISHASYVKEIATILTETVDGDTYIAGLKANAMLDYRINNHFDVYFDASRNFITATDYSTSYTSNKYGIGLNYFIRKRK